MQRRNSPLNLFEDETIESSSSRRGSFEDRIIEILFEDRSNDATKKYDGYIDSEAPVMASLSKTGGAYDVRNY
ncbi:hypothetical protein [Bacillus sp. Marseille-Q3570]|uniref:hypothetical protein n=1 Tax=Bacillus sp. Marseille-Q3570 TaxID=2963522 RepID=UPI0021B77259|nr:hypothetical protein [Bacillus sp. Marseille-Q3570]